MVSVDFTINEGMTLLKCLNFLFTSLWDFESMTDESRNDALKEYNKTLEEMRSITADDMSALFAKYEELRIGIMKDGGNEAADIMVPELSSAEE